MNDLITGLVSAGLLLAAGSAGAAEARRDLQDFDAVVFALPGTLTLQRGDSYEVVIDASDEDMGRIESEVRGSELVLRWSDGPFKLFNRGDRRVRVRVTLPELRALEVAGSGDVEGGTWLSESMEVSVSGSGGARFDELATEELNLEVAGSGSIDVARVDSALARIEIRGSGDITLAGAADRQEIEVMGSGDVSAAELEGARVSVEIMGSGDVQVWANEELSAEIMGSGDVAYRGTPKVDSDRHGSGELRPL